MNLAHAFISSTLPHCPVLLRHRLVLQPTVYNIEECRWRISIARMDRCPEDVPLPPRADMQEGRVAKGKEPVGTVASGRGGDNNGERAGECLSCDLNSSSYESDLMTSGGIVGV